jgi:hypothetical protein
VQELLPSITIKADKGPVEFLNRMARVAGKSNSERYKPSRPGGLDILTIRPAAEVDCKSATVDLFFQDKRSRRASAELRISRPLSERLTYAVYVATVKRILRPVLKEYNQRYLSNRRLQVPSAGSLQPTLTRRNCRRCHDVLGVEVLPSGSIRLGRPRAAIRRNSFASTDSVDGSHPCHDPRPRIELIRRKSAGLPIDRY